MMDGAAHLPRSAAKGRTDEPNGPVSQSIRIGFGVLQAATLFLALGWAASNVRQVPPDTQAVVSRFGQVIRVQQAGLVIAWPRPFEQVDLLPGTQRQLDLHIAAGTATGNAITDPASRANGEVPPETAGVYLTANGGVVLLDASITYRITDAGAYFLAAPHVPPALRRLFLASAVSVAAGQSMDDFLVIRSDGGAQDAAAQARRESIRGAIVAEMNRRLHGLDFPDGTPGVEVTRADVTALLPPAAKFAFDAVLEAAQMADQGLALARTDATRIGQAADQARDRILTEARASANERIGVAQSNVAAITALEQRMNPATRPSLLDQLYRERIAAILKKAGAVNTVDLRGGSRMILPGSQP